MAEALASLPFAAKLALLALPILPNLWCIWQAVTRRFPTETERLIWGGAGVFLPVLGGLLFLCIGRRRVVKETHEPHTNL